MKPPTDYSNKHPTAEAREPMKLLRWRLSTIDEFIAARDDEFNGHLKAHEQ